MSGIIRTFAYVMEDYIQQLNVQQQDAVLYTGGPQLVIAGAGSGKTRVLTYKIVHLLCHGYGRGQYSRLHSPTKQLARCASESKE